MIFDYSKHYLLKRRILPQKEGFKELMKKIIGL